jgi:hypothetical protein
LALTQAQGNACPRCSAPLLSLRLGREEHVCPNCAQQMSVAVFDPPEARGSGPRPVEAADSSPCARHARNLAVASCEHCGAFMCSLCRIDADGKALCAACFERLGSAGELRDTRRSYRHYNGMALHLSVLGLFFWPLSVLLGPLAVMLALRGLKQSERLGEELGKPGARVAIGLGALETLGGAIFAMALFGAFK